MRVSHFLPSLTPKRALERLLSETLVIGTHTNVKSDALVWELLRTYAPNVKIELYNPASWPNPTITATFPYVPLGAVLTDICRLSDVVVEVSDRGALVFRSRTVEERLKHALRVEELLRSGKGEERG